MIDDSVVLVSLKPNDTQRKLVEFLVSILKTSWVSSYITRVTHSESIFDLNSKIHDLQNAHLQWTHKEERALAGGLNVSK